jgi:hypothetical protein
VISTLTCLTKTQENQMNLNFFMNKYSMELYGWLTIGCESTFRLISTNNHHSLLADTWHTTGKLLETSPYQPGALDYSWEHPPNNKAIFGDIWPWILYVTLIVRFMNNVENWSSNASLHVQYTTTCQRCIE